MSSSSSVVPSPAGASFCATWLLCVVAGRLLPHAFDSDGVCFSKGTTAYVPGCFGPPSRVSLKADDTDMPQAPHLILTAIDDLGIDDTSIRVPGSTLPTPNGVISPHIESLAKGGIVLTNWHVFKFCSPSRTQMLTGRYAYHLGQQTQMNLNPDGARCGIHTNFSMLPKLLKARSYRTYMLGKW